MKKNTMTIAERKADLDRQRERLDAFDSIMGKIEDLIKWECMEVKHDDNGEAMHDENGDYIYEAPQEGEWRYDRYRALTSARDEIMNII